MLQNMGDTRPESVNHPLVACRGLAVLACSQHSLEKKNQDQNNKNMTSYHDLEKQVYEKIRAEPYTRITGWPSWQAKEAFIKESKSHALRYRVSYDWSGKIASSRKESGQRNTMPRTQPSQIMLPRATSKHTSISERQPDGGTDPPTVGREQSPQEGLGGAVWF